MKKIMIIVAVALAITGCATKSIVADGKGMYANTKTGVVGIGSFDIEAIPEYTEAAFVRYAEDTAWLSPSTKTHSVKIILTGTNSVENVDSIVKSICEAFAKTPAAKASGKTFFDVAGNVQKEKIAAAAKKLEQVVTEVKECVGDECTYTPSED